MIWMKKRPKEILNKAQEIIDEKFDELKPLSIINRGFWGSEKFLVYTNLSVVNIPSKKNRQKIEDENFEPQDEIQGISFITLPLFEI